MYLDLQCGALDQFRLIIAHGDPRRPCVCRSCGPDIQIIHIYTKAILLHDNHDKYEESRRGSKGGAHRDQPVFIFQIKLGSWLVAVSNSSTTPPTPLMSQSHCGFEDHTATCLTGMMIIQVQLQLSGGLPSLLRGGKSPLSRQEVRDNLLCRARK